VYNLRVAKDGYAPGTLDGVHVDKDSCPVIPAKVTIVLDRQSPDADARFTSYGGGIGVPTVPVPAAQTSLPEFQYSAFSTTIGW
jgi:hypothetical protein